MKQQHWKYGFALLLVVAAASAFAGAPIIPMEWLASISVFGLIGETADISEIKKLVEAQGTAWDEFKKVNDERIAAVEKKGWAPADTVEKLDRLNVALTKATNDLAELQKKAARPPFAADPNAPSPELLAYKAGMVTWMRKGHDDGLRELETKAMGSFSDPDGGYLILPEMDQAIDRFAAAITAMRSLATVRTIGSASYQRLFKTRGVSGGWIDEAADSSESTEPQWAKIEIPAFKSYAEPWVPNETLEDSFYDLEADLSQEVGTTLGELEATAFISGNGVGKPRGILAYPIVANSSYAWGSVGYMFSGGASGFAASNPADKIIDLQHSLKRAYRPGAAFLMNDATLGVMRQFKDASGSYYLWNPDPANGASGTFLGSPVEIDDNMPDIASNAYAIAYANFKRAYTIADRRGIAVIRDPFTKKGVTKFHFSKRVGGGIVNFEAIKLFKIATS